MRHLSATMPAKNTLWMSVALAAAIVAAFLVVVLGTPTKRADAAFPGINGKIAFDSDNEIVTMKANGDNKTQLTNNRANDYDPTFSPNGRKIAFTRVRSGGGDIYTMRANGTHQKRVTMSHSPDLDPAWSPDGTKIAFASYRTRGNSDIYVINQDGTGLTRITTSPEVDTQPAWSPDGTRIAFQRGPYLDTKIYVMKAARESETNIPQRLTTASGSGVDEQAPAWSPNGIRIAFASDQSAPGDTVDLDLYSIRADGSDLIQLTKNVNSARFPAWSPDGTRIAFSGSREKDSTLGSFVMKAEPESETNSPKRISGNGFNTSLDWQPLR